MTGEVAMNPDFRRAEIVAILLIGVISGFVPALQPLLLGQLAAEARISLAQIGQAAMLEALGMALSVSVAGMFLKPVRLKWIAGFAILVAVVVNIATAYLSGAAVLAVRFVGGLGAGLLLWLWMGMLARVAVPARLIAIYITLQAASLLGLSALISGILLPWGGAMAGYGVLALLYAPLLVGIRFIPGKYHRLDGGGGMVLPSGRGLAGLVAVALHLAAIMALWVYVVPLAKQAGVSDEMAGFSVSFALAAQIVAGALAAIVAQRLRAVPALLMCIAASIGAIILLALATTTWLVIASVVIIAFFWMFAPPFQMPYLILVDPSRRAAMQMVTAQLLGVAAGPALASMAVTADSASGAWAASLAMYALAGLIFAATAMGQRALITSER